MRIVFFSLKFPGVEKALVILEDLRVRVLSHPLTQDLIWVCNTALSSLRSLGSTVLSFIPDSVLTKIQSLLNGFTSGIVTQCFNCALLVALGAATGNVFTNQQQVVEAIARLCVQLRNYFFKGV